MLPVIGSLFIGIIAGFLGQRSRMCFIGGFRDFFMIRDKGLLKGVISFFVSAWLTIMLLMFVGNIFPNLKDFTNVRYIVYPHLLDAIFSRFGLISLIGGIGLGFFSTLSGGCPFRHHVMVGQGRKDSIVYLSGFYLGIFFYYLVTVKIIAKFL